MISEHGDGIVAIMDPMFECQYYAIQDFCEGKKDKLCPKGNYCNRRKTINDPCRKAHSNDELLRGVATALTDVNIKVKSQVIQNYQNSHILTQIGYFFFLHYFCVSMLF